MDEKGLTIEQTNWIFLQSKLLVDKYMKLLPLKKENWNSLKDEVVELEKKSKGNKLMIKVNIAIMEYFELLEAP